MLRRNSKPERETQILNTVVRFRTPSGEAMVMLSLEEFEKLQGRAEDIVDAASYDRSRALQAANQDRLPASVVNRLRRGENPLRVWREYRGLAVSGLAIKAGLSQPYVSQLEAGARKGSAAALKKLAMALSIDLDDLV